MVFEKIESFLKNLMSSWQTARIYSIEHRLFIESLEKTYSDLCDVLSGQDELVIGILEKELASGDNIFFELSKKVIQPITHLKKVNIERMVFRKGITKEELIKFISFLIMPVEEIQHAPQEYISAAGIRNIEVGKIKVSVKDSSVQNEAEKTEIIYYKECLDRLSQALDIMMDNDTLDHLSLKFVANNIMENLKGSYQIFSKLRQTKSYDVATFIHLLNVSILSIYFSHELGFSREDCLDIGVAGLFHDIGKLYIAKKILQKKDKLSEKEFDRVKSHTVLGAEILLKHVDDLTALPAVVAFEHHLQYDLKGYPKVSFPRKLHIASLIIMICDVYDALVQRRSYKRDYPPEMIYEVMIKGKGKRYDSNLLDSFFKTMGVWPRGTIVRLSDGRVGVVKEENNDDIFSPVIEVISEAARERIDLKTRNDIKIKQSLNPLSDGKDYFDLI